MPCRTKMQVAVGGTMSRTSAEQIVLAGLRELPLELGVGVEVILDRALRGARDEDQASRRPPRALLRRRIESAACRRSAASLSATPWWRAGSACRGRQRGTRRFGYGAIDNLSVLREEMIPNAAHPCCGAVHDYRGARVRGAGPRTRAWASAGSTRRRRGIGDEDVRLVDLDDARADAFDSHQRFRRREVAVRLAIRDDRFRERRTDSRELAGELRRIGRVDVDGAGRSRQTRSRRTPARSRSEGS